MGILLALGAGKLWSRDSPPPCPLERVDLIAAGGALLVDNQARRCAWRGRCFTCAPGIEDALCWGQRPLLLSGEAFEEHPANMASSRQASRIKEQIFFMVRLHITIIG